MNQFEIKISPVIGGFVVSYPRINAGDLGVVYETAIATTSGKALRIVKTALDAISLPSVKDDTAE